PESVFLRIDFDEPREGEKKKIKENLERLMNRWYQEHNINETVSIREFTPVGYEVDKTSAGKKKLWIKYLVSGRVDNLSFWAYDNDPTMAQSMRDSLRRGL